MTLDKRAGSLVSGFGLTPRQARFATLVALIGGYCLRRQYVAFAGIQAGKNSRTFLDTLASRRIAEKTLPRGNRAFLYHLKARPLYAALGLDNNRNRRRVSPPRQARRVMLLDFAIAHRDAIWYATEREKVELFTAAEGVPIERLPAHVYHGTDGAATTRRFVAKLPICRMPGDSRLCFVTLGLDTSGRQLTRFLAEHDPLLERLPTWRIVIPYPRAFAAGVEAWRAAFAAQYPERLPGLAPSDAVALHEYFRVRWALSGGAIGELTIDRRHEEHRRRFARSQYERLFPFWCAEGGPQRPPDAPPEFSRCRPAGHFSTYELPHSYDLFGTYPGVV